MCKVYGYCRTALKNYEEVAEQIKLIHYYCKDRGLTVERYFYDSGASGLSLDRKGLNELLKVLQKGDVIVTRDIAKLSRSYFQCASLLRRVKDLDITIIIID